MTPPPTNPTPGLAELREALERDVREARKRCLEAANITPREDYMRAFNEGAAHAYGEVETRLVCLASAVEGVVGERPELPVWSTGKPSEPGVYLGYSDIESRAKKPADIYSFDGKVFQHWTGWYDHGVTHWIKTDMPYDPAPPKARAG